ncbi:Uncharacterised protein [Afipia felis]|uniref:Uncharacterized protein n=2 Tax=Afipia felis TaxID=1035 RepID=A0A380W6M4_AFIFE|nr:hypothetical protein HMPREF9697_03484 [Afipia felis ATCC 53690]SUU75700.1 Uncharacterised protein [Afipia felis]SUU83767.1 Uncharacterised protein [Afipia felis]
MVDIDLVDMGFGFGEKTQDSQSMGPNVRSEIGRFDQTNNFTIGACAMIVLMMMVRRSVMAMQRLGLMSGGVMVSMLMLVTMRMVVMVVVVVGMAVRMSGLCIG